MSELKVLDLYHQTQEKTADIFQKKRSSTLRVITDFDKVEVDVEWITMMEESIRYIDNILRNPNRFIVNEEDIVKIELARRVTVESIKHLSRNTNLIQDYDKKTGDVKPSKILNINKEESFNTYENRFIYSLIQNMKSFINRKKNGGISENHLKNIKKFEYNANTKVGEEEINISMQLDSKINSTGADKSSGELNINDRIEKLELQISDLTNSDVYKTLSRLHVALVTSPIKKTNVILKNVNFQYAVKLWNYLQNNIDDNTVREHDFKNYYDSDELKHYVDETFYLNYLVMNTLNNDEATFDEKSVVSEKIIGNMVEQVISLNSSISEEELKNIVVKQFEVIKYKHVTSDKRIAAIFDKYIDKYLNKINDIKI